MGFDDTEYANALDHFLQRMIKLPTVDNESTMEAVDPLCRLFHIARIELIFYENWQDEKKNNGTIQIYYNAGEYNSSEVISKREMTESGSLAIYRAYHDELGEAWSNGEKERVHQLLSMLYIFQGRVRLLDVAERLTFFDQDMGVYNVAYFMKLTSMLLRKGKITKYGVCVYNLRRFSVINQRIGRDNGTRVMKNYIKLLEEAMGPGGFAFRIGGDNFLLLFYKDRFEAVAECLKGANVSYGKQFAEQVFVTTSSGYYSISEECYSPSDIMDRVMLARQAVKLNREKSMIIYSEELALEEHHRKVLESMFPMALRQEEFQVYYQPKVSLETYSLSGAEALCRWLHNGRLVSPGDFIPVMERSQIICELDFYMLDHVCRDIRRWLDEGRRCVKISVNLSRRHLGEPNLLQNILEIIDRNNVPHQYLEIELTETTTEVDFQSLKDLVTGLGKAGISTSIDDFGIGFSSLNLIRQAPWNILKIDKCFLPTEMHSESKQMTMLRHMISMVKEMGLECIVEGVETEEQVAMLKENHCPKVQGFFFDRPLPLEEFENRLELHREAGEDKKYYGSKFNQ